MSSCSHSANSSSYSSYIDETNETIEILENLKLTNSSDTNDKNNTNDTIKTEEKKLNKVGKSLKSTKPSQFAKSQKAREWKQMNQIEREKEEERLERINGRIRKDLESIQKNLDIPILIQYLSETRDGDAFVSDNFDFECRYVKITYLSIQEHQDKDIEVLFYFPEDYPFKPLEIKILGPRLYHNFISWNNELDLSDSLAFMSMDKFVLSVYVILKESTEDDITSNLDKKSNVSNNNNNNNNNDN